ncbi:MAG: hypothetical protein HN368_04020 [Spirochaetales bacterium]|jgi:hypothetical protein|nr:hypothetical protein [Spirochaetales bacterium]
MKIQVNEGKIQAIRCLQYHPWLAALVDQDRWRPYTLHRMKERKTALIFGAGWQLIRFVLVTLCAVLYLNPGLLAGASLLLLWPASASLVLCVVFFFAGSYSERFSSLRGILLFGKFLDVVPGLALLIVQGGALFLGIANPVFDVVKLIDEATGYALVTEVLFYYGLAFVVLLDLIFLLILLSYRTVKAVPEPEPGENLPEFDITQIEEE